MQYQPVIIIGAPRSGTNILRDVITRLPGIETWPCDEINYIWRHGNVRYPGDALPANLASASVVNYIRREFEKMARRHEADVVVEKTCANSLRIPFVQKILPTAKFLFIVRDGVDVVCSAMNRWTAPLDLPYVFRKARFVPPSDIPFYAARYFGNRIHKWLSRDQQLATWGPLSTLLQQRKENCSLVQVCAAQWSECVESAARDLSLVNPDRVHKLEYERFVSNPVEQLGNILDFLARPASNQTITEVTQGVSSKSIGRGRSQMTSKEKAAILPLIQRTLLAHGYRL